MKIGYFTVFAFFSPRYMRGIAFQLNWANMACIAYVQGSLELVLAMIGYQEVLRGRLFLFFNIAALIIDADTQEVLSQLIGKPLNNLFRNLGLSRNLSIQLKFYEHKAKSFQHGWFGLAK